jgi:hypothetical protein
MVRAWNFEAMSESFCKQNLYMANSTKDENITITKCETNLHFISGL